MSSCCEIAEYCVWAICVSFISVVGFLRNYLKIREIEKKI